MMYCMLVAGVVVMSPFRMVFGGNDVPSHLKKKQDIRQVVVQADVITYNAIISMGRSPQFACGDLQMLCEH